MPKSIRIVFLALVVMGAFLAGAWYTRQGSPGAAPAAATRLPLRYICPMHPQYASDRPGTAPCCGMRLEPVYPGGGAADAGGAEALPPGAVRISFERRQLIGIQVAEAGRSGGKHVLRVPGRVAPDETRTYVVSASAAGWIRDVYPVTTGSQVTRNQPLAAFYTKEFLPAQQQFFYGISNLDRVTQAKNQSPEQLNLTQVQVWSYEDALEELGMDEIQRAEIAKSRKFARRIILRSPGDGFVLARNISPGQRFERGQELFRIAELERVWVLADLFEKEAGHARVGLPANVLYQQKTYAARVSDVLPQFDPDTRTLKVRLEMDNPGFVLRPDMFVDVEIPIELPAAITVPADAVVDSGLRKTVYVERSDGVFEPRNIETGWRIADRVEVIHGLQAGERIVVSGNFLLDSETRMKQAADGVRAPARDLVCGMDVDQVRARAAGRAGEYRGKTYYFCSDECRRAFEKSPAEYGAR
jgi:RND family efflux transporter MFP subunit